MAWRLYGWRFVFPFATGSVCVRAKNVGDARDKAIDAIKNHEVLRKGFFKEERDKAIDLILKEPPNTHDEQVFFYHT